jgi:hypothetical protein
MTPVDIQTAFNIAVMLIGGLGGWVLKSISDEIKELKSSDASQQDKIQKVEVLVAGTYVKNEALERLSSSLFAKLDRIESKIDKKQDKI